MAPARLAARLVAALAQIAAAAVVTAQCTGSTYSYGSGACASCAAGASFVSAAAGCTPSASLPGPTDTAFYLSGSKAEGVGALVLTGAAPSFVDDHAGAANGALAIASGAHLDAAGASAPAALPSGDNVAWSASAWVKCAAPVTYAAVLEWGAAGDAQGAASVQTAALVVAAAGSSALVGIVSPLVSVPFVCSEARECRVRARGVRNLAASPRRRPKPRVCRKRKCDDGGGGVHRFGVHTIPRLPGACGRTRSCAAILFTSLLDSSSSFPNVPLGADRCARRRRRCNPLHCSGGLSACGAAP